jgi:Domain of unknown function (DUF4136)
MYKFNISLSLAFILLFSSIQSFAVDSKITSLKVRHDHRYDFSQINKKYTWTEYIRDTQKESMEYDTEVDKLVTDSINKTLLSKGFEQTTADDASFGIDYHIVVEDEGSTSTHVRRGGSRVNSRSYANIEGMPSIENWRKGSLFINIVNLENGYVVWVGYADAIIIEKTKREELINQAVSEMLDQFPPK